MSAEQGNVYAQNKLWNMYFYNYGDYKSHSEALKWLKLYADNNKREQDNNADLQYKIGFIYLDGDNLVKNFSEAFKWFKLSAENGDKRAEEKLTYAQIFISAEQGNAQAQYELGNLYYRGNCISRNITESFKWLKFQGHREARDQFERMYLNGEGNDIIGV